MKSPSDLHTMEELRVAIDALDRELVEMLGARTRLIARAAELKQGNGWPARIPDRVEDVVAKVRAAAGPAGLDPDLADRLWREMIEHFIAQEEQVLGKGDPDERHDH
ncbi:chorismate mutase [Thioclava sediminum]|uniref:chorismate mutase n=2 Tax=Thioclava TaxID=285107 RepID=A0ABX6YPV1_9RHOB|nr:MULTISPECIES: chorismate mutase [Thioclava]MAQ35801.1 chorismate mutase [Thioclava sp.]OOY04377.1 chorismate mutase [Thioclava sp. F28-4]OOY08038.1 chorismate mutase [Thioclava sp. F36-7]OOY22173.1 chorismate mutase [Thioclava sp. DLFJ5-1]OOY26013.1 chorismate mutase [Thioclava sediminum]